MIKITIFRQFLYMNTSISMNNNKFERKFMKNLLREKTFDHLYSQYIYKIEIIVSNLIIKIILNTFIVLEKIAKI